METQELVIKQDASNPFKGGGFNSSWLGRLALLLPFKLQLLLENHLVHFGLILEGPFLIRV